MRRLFEERQSCRDWLAHCWTSYVFLSCSCFYFLQWLCSIYQWNACHDDTVLINRWINLMIDYFINRLIVAALLAIQFSFFMQTAVITCHGNMHVRPSSTCMWFYQMQTFYFSFCIFSILADSRNQLCVVGSQWIHLYRTGIYGYGYGWEISYPRQPWTFAWAVPLHCGI